MGMKMFNVKGFNNLKKDYCKPKNTHLDRLVSRMLAEVLFVTRTTTTSQENTTLIDARYYKVVYLRNEDKYLVIGRHTEKLSWENLPSSIKTMLRKKEIPLIVE